MMRKSSLTNQRKLHVMKVQHSEDSKKFKTKKSQKSISPFRKQIILNNKQNIHPNIFLKNQQVNIAQDYINKLCIHSPTISHEQNFCSVFASQSQKQQRNRDPYYVLKQQSLNKKIHHLNLRQKQRDKNSQYCESNVSKRKNNINKKTSREKELISKFTNCNLLLSPANKDKVRLSPNPNRKAEKKKEKKNEKENQKPVLVRIDNSSLQKCQLLHHRQEIINDLGKKQFKETPKAAYLVTCNQSTQVQFACCQQCAAKYEKISPKINIIPISSLKNYNAEQQLSTQLYLHHLNEHQQFLLQIQANITNTEQHFRKMCEKQQKSHRDYYNKMFQIVQQAMLNSQSVLATYFNSGYEILSQKSNQVEKVIKELESQIKMVCELKNDKNSQTIESRKLREKKKSNMLLHKQMQKRIREIELPLILVNSNKDQILEKFKTLFNENFAIKLVSHDQISNDAKKQGPLVQSSKQRVQQQNNKQRIQPENDKINMQNRASLQSTKTNHENKANLDLFCDEILGQNSNNFSFDGNDQKEDFNVQCIVQLTEQEDVISPVFKAI